MGSNQKQPQVIPHWYHEQQTVGIRLLWASAQHCINVLEKGQKTLTYETILENITLK